MSGTSAEIASALQTAYGAFSGTLKATGTITDRIFSTTEVGIIREITNPQTGQYSISVTSLSSSNHVTSQ